ncbi:MAG: hypothetical protein KKE73_09675 [Proteobacteria bacterium]|nr:hypothetical protein [Pseudomonadota bacterium]
MSERAKFRGRLAEAEDLAHKLSLKANGLVIALRDNLDPLTELADLPVDIIGQQALELHQAVMELRAEHDKIDRITKLLED